MAENTKDSLAQRLIGACDNNRLGHALLLKVLGNKELSFFDSEFSNIVKALLCQERLPQQLACGECQSCKLLVPSDIAQHGNRHPDTLWLEPLNGKAYTVEQIRKVHSFLSLRKNLSPNRVIWISQAELLYGNQGAAANALLKVLEEPRDGIYLLLSSQQPELLMSTLQSRCHQYLLVREHSETSVDLSAWKSMLTWLQAGATVHETFEVPADQESFWKDRESALREFQLVLPALWTKLRPSFYDFSPQEAGRVLDFFAHSEILLKSIKGYANAPLQWLNFKLNARKGNLWKLSK